MNIFELRFKVYLLENIILKDLHTKITALIDLALSKSEEMIELHQENKYKMYSFDRLYPLEKDKVYKKDKIYAFTIRTIDKDLARYFSEVLINTYSKEIKCLTAEVKTIPKRLLETVYSVTPVVLKTPSGYWRNVISLEEYGERLKINLVKKYNTYFQEKLDENFELYNRIEFLNSNPIPINYKNIVVLGDKLKLYISDNSTAQLLAYMCLGTGICEMNARGNGFVNYQWYK